jgi:hypothetical protein
MNRQAISKAERNLARMRAALDNLNSADSNAQIEAAWEDFVIAAGTFHKTLGEGAKQSNRSRNWFATKTRDRRTDLLLQYVHHARNAEQHGIRAIAEPASSQITMRGQGTMVTVVDTAPGEWTVVEVKGDVTFANDRARLVTVSDRNGTPFAPPISHFGQTLQGKTPVAVARLALAYFE